VNQLNSFTLYNSEKIPKSQGLYAFYLNSISKEKVGLLGRGPFSEGELTKARGKIVYKITKACNFLRSTKLEGVIKDNRFSSTINNSYRITALEEYSNDFIGKIENIPLNSLLAYLSLLKYTPLFSQPIYVGIIKRQTLYDRYHQHMKNHETNEGSNNFGRRLSGSGFQWDEVIFSCIEFHHTEEDLDLLDIIEKQMQVITQPILSIR